MSDSKHSKGGAHLSGAHLPKANEVKSHRPRQAGSMLMASARIEADATCRPGDPSAPVLRKHAVTSAEQVRTEAPEYMQQVGAGGELVPASMAGENSRALAYRSTVDRPDGGHRGQPGPVGTGRQSGRARDGSRSCRHHPG